MLEGSLGAPVHIYLEIGSDEVGIQPVLRLCVIRYLNTIPIHYFAIVWETGSTYADT